MIWRKGLPSRTKEGWNPSSLSAQDLTGRPLDLAAEPLILAGWAPASFLVHARWAKLFSASLPGRLPLFCLIQSQPDRKPLIQAASCLPPSLEGRVTAWLDPEDSLRQDLEPGPGEESFAWFPALGAVVLGPPSDSAWESLLPRVEAALPSNDPL